MILKDKISKIPNWNKNNINRWADYIELLCLYNEDHFVSIDDVLNIFFNGGMEELQRGEAEHSAKYDDLVAVIGNYYEMIKYRHLTHIDYYPFKIEDGQCISLREKLSEKHMHYIFLLLCSSICFIDQSSLQRITHVFEKYCQPIMSILMPGDAQTELFGTTRGNTLFNGTLRSRISQLANILGAQTTKSMDSNKKYDLIHAGDAGLDIVSFLKLDDASHIPFALGQCTCSYDEWINKQFSIDRETWSARIDPLAPFWRYMYIPFFNHDASGRLENPTQVYTCLIDRQRILKIIDLHNELLVETAPLNIKDLIMEIW